MKVLFLDVDGVLNSTPDYLVRTEHGGFPINMGKIDILKDIIDATGCEIVVSSAWRKSDLFFHLLKCLPKTPLDKTPVFNSGCRGEEIKLWLDENKGVESYAILDDDSDMLPEQLPYFVQTELDYGLTKGLAYRVKYILNKGGNK